MDEYALYLRGKRPERAASASGRRCAEVGVRYGALKGIMSALPALEAAVAANDEAAAEAPGARIRAALDTFRLYPPRPFGQPPGSRKATAARTVEMASGGDERLAPNRDRSSTDRRDRAGKGIPDGQEVLPCG